MIRHKTQSELKKQEIPLNNFYSKIYRHYDLINSLITFGRDKHWRKRVARESITNKPGKILDLCCGTGVQTHMIHEVLNTDQEVTGFDLNEGMLKIAKSKPGDKKNIKFVKGDAADMPFADLTFDTVTISFGLRNLLYENRNSDKHLSEISRVLKEKGRLIILESSKPKNRIIRFFYRIYLHTMVRLTGGMISGDFKAYRYLGRSSGKFLQPEELQGILSEYGFLGFDVHKYFFGSVNLIIASK